MLRVSLTAVLCASLFGCGRGEPRVVKVEGTVLRNGQPVSNVFVNFLPLTVGQHGRPSWGQTDDSGHFVLHYDRDRDGAEIGKHRVFVAFRAANPKEEADIVAGRKTFHPDRKAIEEKFGTMERSPLTIDIVSETKTLNVNLD